MITQNDILENPVCGIINVIRYIWGEHVLGSTLRLPLIWGGIYVAMLLSLLTPLSLITLHIMMVPLVVMLVIADRVKALIVIGVIVIALALFLPGLGTFLSLLTIFYLVPAGAMAIYYRRDQNTGQAIIAGIVAFIAIILGLLLILSIFRFNLNTFMADTLKDNEAVMVWLSAMVSAENIDRAIYMITLMAPLMIIIYSVYTTVLAHWISRKLLARYQVNIPKLKPMKEWKLPKSIIYIYLVLLLLEFFFVFEMDSVVNVILLNAVPLLTYAIALQGIGLLYFIADHKGWNRALPIAGIVLLPFIPQLISWIGVADMAFPVRSKLTQKDG